MTQFTVGDRVVYNTEAKPGQAFAASLAGKPGGVDRIVDEVAYVIFDNDVRPRVVALNNLSKETPPVTFKVGDRVRYVNGQRKDWKDKAASVTRVRPDGQIEVHFDEPHSSGIYVGRNIPPSSLELILMIDTTKPLQIKNDFGVYDVTFITDTSDNNILVNIAPGGGLAPGWIIYDRNGKFVRSADGAGSATTLQNKITRKEVFVRIASSAYSGQVSLHREDPTGTEVTSVKVVYEDGIAVSAELVRSSERPTTAINEGVGPSSNVVTL